MQQLELNWTSNVSLVEQQFLIGKTHNEQGRYLRLHAQYTRWIWKRCFLSENTSNVFPPRYAGEIWKGNNHWLFWIIFLNLCLSTTLAEENHDYDRDVIVLEKLRFQNDFRPH